MVPNAVVLPTPNAPAAAVRSAASAWRCWRTRRGGDTAVRERHDGRSAPPCHFRRPKVLGGLLIASRSASATTACRRTTRQKARLRGAGHHDDPQRGRRALLVGWFMGGLHYQVEHHIFPTGERTRRSGGGVRQACSGLQLLCGAAICFSPLAPPSPCGCCAAPAVPRHNLKAVPRDGGAHREQARHPVPVSKLRRICRCGEQYIAGLR